MHGYITNVLNKFQHDAPRTPQHTASKYITPVYGAKMQFATQDNSPSLTVTQCTEIQRITGSILYYSRAVDPTVLMALYDSNGANSSYRKNENGGRSTVRLLSDPP
jgi:hypothetical protein